MWETIWNQFVRISDFIFFNNEKGIIHFLNCIFIYSHYLSSYQTYYTIINRARMGIVPFLFFIAIILSVFILQRLPVMIEKEYLIYTIVAFSIYIAIRRSVALLKKKTKYRNSYVVPISLVTRSTKR